MTLMRAIVEIYVEVDDSHRSGMETVQHELLQQVDMAMDQVGMMMHEELSVVEEVYHKVPDVSW